MREADIPGAARAAFVRSIPLVANAVLAVWWAVQMRDMHEADLARDIELYGSPRMYGREWSDAGLVAGVAGVVAAYVGLTALVHLGLRRELPSRGVAAIEGWPTRLGLEWLIALLSLMFLTIPTLGLVSWAAEVNVAGLGLGLALFATAILLVLWNPVLVVDETGVRRWTVGTWLPITTFVPRTQVSDVALVQVYRGVASTPFAFRIEAVRDGGRRLLLAVVPGARGPHGAEDELARWRTLLGLGARLAA